VSSRFSQLAIHTYVEADEHAHKSADSFFLDKLRLITPSVMTLLDGWTAVSPDQFRRNAKTLTTLLSRLVACDDRIVRTLVLGVYEKKLNPIILSLLA
jgi:hypothetical protein